MKATSSDFAAHLAELQQRLQSLTQAMTQADRSKVVQALLSGLADRFELVLREDLQAQTRQLERATEQIAQLEARLALLESARPRD